MDESTLANEYQLMEELGSGSFGVVYKAIERATGEIVAVKHIDLESSEEDIQEIQGEINVLSTCSSPFVTQYKRSFLKGSKLWIVMEYLGGGSAQDLLKPGPFNESHVAIICREVLLGLAYLHREGKIHRDIKAANLLLANSGKVKLADFGVAAQLTNLKSMRNTFVGTPFWMAPEVIQENGYDYKADIWSLGITAMELIHGEPPHSQIHPMKVLFHIPKAPAPRLEGPHYSRDFKDFIAKCLVKDPDHRATAKQLLQHRFIRHAGKVEGLQELIQRKLMWDANKERASLPKYYEETLKMVKAQVEEDDWVFETVKKAPVLTHTQRRRPSSQETTLIAEDGPEDMMSKLTISERSTQAFQEPTPNTMRRVSTKRRASPSIITSSKRKVSTSRRVSAQRKPLAPDMSFGNTASTVRVFSRVSDNSPDGTLERNDENCPPDQENVTKEALLGRRAYSKAIDHAFQEVYAQTASQAKREAIARVAEAWQALDMDDPEGECQLLRLMIQKISADARLAHGVLPAPTPPSTPLQRPKLVLAQNNPHLKSHRRRQSSIVPGQNTQQQEGWLREKPAERLPAVVPGMEHERQLAEALYGKWVEGLKARWGGL